jgi:hypothetical protein
VSVFGSNKNETPAYITAEAMQAKVEELTRFARQEFITRDDATAHVAALADLDRRVTDLENLARTLRAGTASTTNAREGVGTSSASATGVDYGAIAFGLSEIKRKVTQVTGLRESGEMRREYAGAVQYFADVFAKADPQFDADAFKRQSGV